MPLLFAFFGRRRSLRHAPCLVEFTGGGSSQETSINTKVYTFKMNSVLLRRIRAVPFQTSLWMLIRTMKSVNTRKPKPMHIMRAKLMKVTEWKQRQDSRPLPLLCSRIAAKQRVQTAIVPNPALEFAARQFYKLLMSSRMVAIYHHNGIDMEAKTNLQKKLSKANIQLHIIGNETARTGTSGSKFTNMQPLFVGNNLYAVSEVTNLKELLKVTRKVPNLLLIGGLLEDQLMSAVDLEHFASLPSLETIQCQLAGLLSSGLSTTCRYLQANQQSLSTNLSQLQSQQNE